MRSKWIFWVFLSLAAAAWAKDPKPYQTANIVQMSSVPCSTTAIATGSASDQQPLCQEYVLQSEHVVYHIRPSHQHEHEKHAVLLPVDNRAQFRLQNNKMLLRLEGPDGDDSSNSKEREYIVVSMAPLSDSSTADATPVHLNHLQ
jgi:hypothetical protein